MKNNTKMERISYEPEADVLTLEITDQAIDHAKEIGNVVVHFTKRNTPVLVEILEATKFLTKAQGLLRKNGSARTLNPAYQ
ncbi:MAG: DUF2283 domain-containing protein [bacterium]|nr:DUF2283 domain-containing protein [bacterium]